jgi:hypothetical protein
LQRKTGAFRTQNNYYSFFIEVSLQNQNHFMDFQTRGW